MREESAISLLSKLPETKGQIGTFVRNVKEYVLSGEMGDKDILLLAARLKGLEKTVKAIELDILVKDVILEAAERKGEKNFDEGNANFRIQETGVKYDYDACGDAEYKEIKEQYDKWAKKKKEREEFLKTIKPDLEVYGKDGTMLTPPPKSSTTQVVISLK